MQVNHRFRMLALGALMLAWAGAGQAAQQEVLDLSLPSHSYVQNAGSFMLAANDTDVLVKKQDAPAATSATQQPFEPPLWTASNAHMYLGLATIATAFATAATAPESCEHNCPATLPPRETNGTHAKLAKTTVALAAATIATGLWAHWDDFYLEDGWKDPDNLHVLLGVTGAALMAYATNKSAKSAVPVSHAGIAELGALGMVVAIKLTW